MKVLTTLSFLVLSFAAKAQMVEIPAKEFQLNLSENTVSIKPGESKQVTLTLVKSKSFVKSKAVMGMSSALPKGIAVNYDEPEGTLTSTLVTISVGPEVSNGIYQLILNATMRYKTKGAILKVSVGPDNLASK